MAEVEDQLSDEERARNQHGPIRLYQYTNEDQGSLECVGELADVTVISTSKVFNFFSTGGSFTTHINVCSLKIYLGKIRSVFYCGASNYIP